MAHVKYDNAADWLHDLGDVPLERIIMDPPPGTATERDLLVLVERDKRLCELVDGTLVEKPVGYLESLIAGCLITELNNFIGSRNLGYVSGEAGMMRMLSGRVRLPDIQSDRSEQLLSRWAADPQVAGLLHAARLRKPAGSIMKRSGMQSEPSDGRIR